MVKIDPLKRGTLTEQIIEQIASWITSNKFNPGDKLPNERLLAEKFQVNRGRIREALRALALIGLITIKPGEGSFVSEKESGLPAETILWMYHTEVNNLEEIYAARKLIESEIYLNAAERLTNREIKYIDEIMERLTNSTNLSNEEFQKLLDEFDLFMGSCCGNEIYNKLMQTIVHLRHKSMVNILNVPGARKNSIDSRIKLVEAFKKRDLNMVKEAIDYNFTGAKKFYKS